MEYTRINTQLIEQFHDCVQWATRHSFEIIYPFTIVIFDSSLSLMESIPLTWQILDTLQQQKKLVSR